MSETTLIVLIVAAAIILLVLLYNVYQESRYRKQIRQQFGHSDQDALLDGQKKQVRDGDGEFVNGSQLKPALQKKNIHLSTNMNDVKPVEKSIHEPEEVKPIVDITEKPATAKLETVVVEETISISEMGVEHELKEVVADNVVVEKTALASKSRNKKLLTIKELAQVELPWFDKRFDYMAYVALDEPQELHALPRLSNRHYFRVAACTMDDHFQLAEPIPSVFYQGFVMGLQGISRSGLVSKDDILSFADHVQAFAMKVNGQVLLTDVDEFLSVAKPLDDLCARVDQMIAMHLVSREIIMGAAMRTALEDLGFNLMDDGSFAFTDVQEQTLFTVVSLDNKPFTNAALDNQSYRGFSMLFDVPNVPHGVKSFDQFMDLVVKLSSQLSLELVDDNLEELSMQSLKNIRHYVVSRQEEMGKIGLEPGSELTRRLFY